MKKKILLYGIFFLSFSGAFSQELISHEEVGGVLIYNCTEDEVSRDYGSKQYFRGIKYFNEQKYQLAADYFSKAMGKVHDDQIYLFRGRANMHSGFYEKALDDFLEDNKTYPQRASLDLARTYAAKGDAQKAIYYLKENFSSPYKKSWSSIANEKFFLYLQNNPVWQAYLKDQVISEPEKLAIEAGAKVNEKKFPEALSLITSALNLQPDNADWYDLRAKIKLELKQFDESVKDYKKEYRLDDKRFNEVYKNIAIVYVRKGELKKASLLLNEIVHKDSLQSFLLLDIAEIELNRFDTQKALDAVNAYLAILPDDDEGYYIRANIAEGEDAKRDINRAIAICLEQNKKVPAMYYELLSSLK